MRDTVRDRVRVGGSSLVTGHRAASPRAVARPSPCLVPRPPACLVRVRVRLMNPNLNPSPKPDPSQTAAMPGKVQARISPVYLPYFSLHSPKYLPLPGELEPPSLGELPSLRPLGGLGLGLG